MKLTFSTTSKTSLEHGIKMLVYAPAGHGKTRLLSTAPSPFLFSAESGALSLREFNIPMAEISTLEGLFEAYRWVTESKEAQAYQTIGLDSITEIAEVLLSTSKKMVKDPRQAYGELLDKMITVIKSFRDLKGKHIYMTAKAETIKEELTGILKYGPSMPGTKVGPAIPYLFDEVFYLGVNKDQAGTPFRYLLTQPDIQYVAKDRSGALATFEYPDITSIITKIQGAQNG